MWSVSEWREERNTFACILRLISFAETNERKACQTEGESLKKLHHMRPQIAYSDASILPEVLRI